MLVAGEVKGELARITPARACCRRAELAGLLLASGPDGELSTLDHATARTAVQIATALGRALAPPERATTSRPGPGSRHHLRVRLDPAAIGDWRWESAPSCDHRAFLRGVLLGAGSLSFGPRGSHVEFTFRTRDAANLLAARLREHGVRALRVERRGRHLVYLKGQEEIVGLLRLVGANRGVLELETARVSHEVRSRLNRLLNAEQANLGRTVRAADRQLHAIAGLRDAGLLHSLPNALREAALIRIRHPEADLDELARVMGVSRSAANHRLRRIVEVAEEDAPATNSAGR
jgi:hypothetical protein